jgi:hypothetical protein
MGIPKETPNVLNPALEKLSHLCDLIAYLSFVGRKTKYGEKAGPSDWHWTTHFVEQYADCTPQEAIELFKVAGAENDREALFYVAVSEHLIA